MKPIDNGGYLRLTDLDITYGEKQGHSKGKMRNVRKTSGSSLVEVL